jgi:alkylation response protein AidB-like acyl-CoA dehydrogenase
VVSATYATVFDEDELAFRDEIDAVVAAQPGLGRRQSFAGRGGAARELYQACGDRGWLSQTWPAEFGGMGRPISYEFLLWDTLAERRAGRPDLGPGLVAHVLITRGSAEQQARFLPDLAAGTLACALGYSEPEAGSDLTHLRTRAVLDGDVYIVNGHKIWTSEAHHASRLWLLCRTGEPDSGRNGLTLLFVDLRSPGITITPIETMDGHQLNEIFLDDVSVPVADRVGAEGAAWEIIRNSLAVERHTQVLPGRLRSDLSDLRAALDRAGLTGRSDVERRLDELAARVAVVEAASLATVSELLAGGSAVIRAARAKFLGSELCQAIPRVGLELLGVDAVVDDDDIGFLWRQSILETIAGGTVEIMLSLLAREELGLGSAR